MEFSRPAAATRLLSLLGGLGLPASRIDYAAGGRHRYTVHRVICPGLPDWPLDHAWLLGYRRLSDSGGYRSVRQRRHRTALAEAAWRAAVVTGGVRGGGRTGPLAVRVTDTDIAAILVRAARVLDAPARLRSVGSGHLVEVTAGAAELALRQLAAVPLPGGLRGPQGEASRAGLAGGLRGPQGEASRAGHAVAAVAS